MQRKIKENTQNMANADMIGRSYSFKRGWNQLQQKDSKAVRAEIMNALGLDSYPSFYPRLNGSIEPKISEFDAIEAIFAKYGITDVWGEE